MENIKIPTEKTKKRIRVECPPTELLTAVCVSLFLNWEIDLTNKGDLIRNVLEGNDTNNKLEKEWKISCTSEKIYAEYRSNLLKWRKCRIDSYISPLMKELKRLRVTHFKNLRNVKIQICGKSIEDPEIKKLTEGIVKKENKADIFIINEDEDNIYNKYIGISVKQSPKCTKTNLSVHEIIRNQLPDIVKKLKEKHEEIIKNVCKDETPTKCHRKGINKCLKNPNNYFIYLDKIILDKDVKEIISEGILKALYPKDLPYLLLEYNGNKLYSLVRQDRYEFQISYDEGFYFTKKGKRRKAAKLFYRGELFEEVDSKKTILKSFRIECRFKGAQYKVGTSPQLLLHEI